MARYWQEVRRRRRDLGRISPRRLLCELLENRRLLAVTFTDINPDVSDLSNPNGSSGGRVNGLAVAPGTSNQTMYAASEFGGLFKTIDGGQNWSRLDRHLPTRGRDVKVDPNNINKVYATSLFDGRVNSISGIQISTDGGDTWRHPATATPPPTFSCAFGLNRQPSAYGIAIRSDVTSNVFVGTSCGVARSTDSGATWTFIDPTEVAPGGTPFNPTSPAGTVWDVVVQAGGTVDVLTSVGHFRSTDNGNTWSGGTGGLPGGLGTIAVSPDESYVVLVSTGGDNNLWESDDAGLTWTNLGTPDSRRQGREMLVATNQRSDSGGADIFDVWFGDVSLFRAECTSQTAIGGTPRCPTARTGAPANSPPANWNGPFTRTNGGHDDLGDILFDTTVAADAAATLFSSDGGVHRRTGGTVNSPTWTRSNVGLHGLWLYAMDGADLPGVEDEDLYFGLQDDGSWGTRKAGRNPTPNDWHNEDCCDVFNMVADAEQVVYDVCCMGGNSTFFTGGRDRLIGSSAFMAPPGGFPATFAFQDVVGTFGTDQFVMATSAGVFFTNDIDDLGGASPWTQLDAVNDPATAFGGAFVEVALAGGVPTFFVQAGPQLWSFTGTNSATANWTRLDNNPGGGNIGFFAVDPVNPNRLYATRPGGLVGTQIIFSANGGATWNNDPELENLMTLGGFFNAFTPSLLAFDRESSNILVAGGNDSGLFLSTDAGGSWRLISDPIDSGSSGVTHLPEPRYAYFDHEPTLADATVYIGTRERGVWRVDVSDLDLDPDEFEPNNFIATSTVLGSKAKITLRDLTIHNPTDVDFFQYTADMTGKLLVNLWDDFNGVLDVQVRDVNGNLIATGTQNDTIPGKNRQQLAIPVVSQEQYFIEVFSSVGHTNDYSLEIENFAAPLVDSVDLPAKDKDEILNDTGMDVFDDVTSQTRPEIILEADLNDFAEMGIDILTDAEAVAMDVPGAAVEVFVNGNSVGFADPIAGTGNTLFRFEFGFGDLPATLFPADSKGNLHYVKGAVRIIDGQRDIAGAAAAAKGRTQLSEPLKLVVDTVAPAGTVPDMLDASDSGWLNADNVTNIVNPAFQGTAEHNAKVRIFAQDVTIPVAPGPWELVGQGVAGSDETDGDFDQVGTWEITIEPLDDHAHMASVHFGNYRIRAEIEDLAGNITTTDSMEIWIDTHVPNTPYLDLVDADDSGRHNYDNVTNVNQPTFTVTANDTPTGDGNPMPNDLFFRIFDRPDPAIGEVLVFASAPFAVGGFFTVSFAGIPYTLVDGVHNLKLEVEDRAGNISHEFLLPVTVDTIAPAPPTIKIDPANTDTGVEGFPSTFVDDITSDTATGFVGQAEADSIVRLWADGPPVSGGVIDGADVFQGLTVAVPEDGNQAFPNGQWNQAGRFDLNDPTVVFPLDGVRQIGATAEDLAGNEGQAAFLDIFVDTQGPKITAVEINKQGDPYDLFDPKPSEDGPTPLVNSLVISVLDPPNRVAPPPFLYPAMIKAVAETPGHYRLIGDANGVIPIDNITFLTTPPLANGAPAEATITLNFAEPLPDDRFTLIISDSLTDPVGNALDGESNAAEPHDIPGFPSGDGVPGGSFEARFTIDSRPEIGTWAAGNVWVDTNGNFHFDPNNRDFTNRDIVYTMGFTSDNVFAGNFANEDGVTDGFDKLAAYGSVQGDFRWLFDTDNDGDPDQQVPNGDDINGLPVAGDFDAARAGDELALFVGFDYQSLQSGTWFFYDLAGAPISSVIIPGMRGYPFVGDFDGKDGDDLGAFADDVFQISLRQPDGSYDTNLIEFRFGFIGVRERPVAADMNQDGIDDIGLWVPDRSGVSPREGSEWYFLLSGDDNFNRAADLDSAFRMTADGIIDTVLDRRISADNEVIEVRDPNVVVEFRPIPFGRDIYAQFGDDFAEPIVGNFDPPVSRGVGTIPPPERDLLDVNSDGFVSPIDALMIIDYLNGVDRSSDPAVWSPDDVAPTAHLDTNRDGIVSPLDALKVINHLNSLANMVNAAEGEANSGGVDARSKSIVGAALSDEARSLDAVTVKSLVPNWRVSPETSVVRTTLIELSAMTELFDELHEQDFRVIVDDAVLDDIAGDALGESLQLPG